MIIKLNQLAPLYVVMFDTAGVEKTGLSAATVVVAKNGAAPVTLTAGTHYAWTQVSSSAMPGLYLITPLTTAMSNVAGDCVLYVSAIGCKTTKRGYLVGSDVWEQQIPASPAAGTAGEALRLLKLANLGRMRINSGTKQLEIYAEDGTTVAMRFNLKDLGGAPTDVGATERVPTP